MKHKAIKKGEVEYKNLEVEIKEIDEKGNFKGLLSPYNNIDYGNDRVLPTVGPRNHNKNIPFLFQHEKKKVIGKLLMLNTKEGIAVEGKVFLDKDGDTFMIPKAAETYALMKHGMLKLSIGYLTHKFKYDEKGIRDLVDIEIKEGSAVTFPMNDKASISDVKGEVEDIEGDAKDIKSASFANIVKVDEMRRKRYQNMRALDISLDSALRDEEMTNDEKKKMVEDNIDQFSDSMKEVMNVLVESQKSDEEDIEKKAFLDELETKKGAVLSKGNMGKISEVIKILSDLVNIPDEGKNIGDEVIELKTEEITLNFGIGK